MFNKKSDKQLQKRIDFKSFVTILLVVLSAYQIMMVVWLGHNIVIYLFPLMTMSLVTLYFLYKDDRIEKDNIELQKEIDKIKHLHDVRKKSEEYFDSA